MVDSDEHSREDSEWQGTASLGTEELVEAGGWAAGGWAAGGWVSGGWASLYCRRLPLRAVLLGPPGGLLGGCEGMVGLPGDWPGDGSWLEVVLGPCPFPESPGACWEGPGGAEAEKPERGRGWIWVFRSSWEPLVEPESAWPGGWIWVFLSSWEPLAEPESAWPGDAELGMVRE